MAFCALFGYAETVCACIDSMSVRVVSVTCHGLRNGAVYVDTVFGSEGPFYFSLDGLIWSTRPEFDRLGPGSYLLRVRNPQGCQASRLVEVFEPELLEVFLEADRYEVPQGGVVALHATVLPAGTPLSSVTWRPPGIDDGNQSLSITFAPKETTPVAVEVHTDRGCSASSQVLLEVEQSKLYFPNAIQPGSDLNAFFTVYSDEALRLVRHLQVYDRTGGLLFERHHFEPNQPALGWNGQAAGSAVLPGTYTWSAVLEFSDGHTEHRVGVLHVL